VAEEEPTIVKVFLRGDVVVLQQGSAQIELKTRAQAVTVSRLIMRHSSKREEDWDD